MKLRLLSLAALLFLSSPLAEAQSLPTQSVCGAASSCVFKAQAGALLDAYATAEGTAGWLYIFNSTSAPANGSVTAGLAAGDYQECVYVQANQSTGLAVTGTPPIYFSSGVTAVFSSTPCGTLTAASAYFISGRVQ